jgi:hypothetical protein
MNKISELSSDYMKKFRNNADVICNLSMLTQNMPIGAIESLPPLERTPSLAIQNIDDDDKDLLMIK